MARQAGQAGQTASSGGAGGMKRRGMIAAAAALAAGLLAKNAADAPRVAASSGGGDQGFLALGSNPWYVAGNPPTANTAAVSSAPTVITASVNFGNFVGDNGADNVVFKADATTANSNVINGIYGYARGGGVGVTGTGGVGLFGSGTDYGVQGSGTNYGVQGLGNIGVFGATGSGNGVKGTASDGTGVFALSGSGSGVFATSTSGVGVNANSGSSIGVLSNGFTGVYAIGTANGVYSFGGTTGVYGTSTTGIGVYGISGGGSGQPFGVVGAVTHAPGFALYGVASVAGTVAFAAGAGVAGAIAGQFAGPVNILNNGAVAPGDLFVQGNSTVSGTKSAAVPHPDGSHRLLYCVESPEAWFEDFGTGTLSGGKAEVKLDADFAAVVDTTTLHVFLTPHDAAHHLAVTARAGGRFSVTAESVGAAAAKGLKASDVNGTFSYRAVAKRKDVKADRLAKFTLPQEIKTPALVTPPAPPAPKAKS